MNIFHRNAIVNISFGYCNQSISRIRNTSRMVTRSTSAEHMLAIYQTWEEVRERKFNVLIITGATIEMLPFQDVVYCCELTQILD